MNSNKTRVASVSSGKGGVGKTFVTISLAASFARKGESVLAVDCDLGLANMDIMLGINPKNTLKDIVFGALPVKDAIIHTKAGFDLLPGSSGIKELAHPMYEKIQDIKTVLEPVFCDYDHVLLDTGAGISDVVLYTISLAHDVLVVTTPEPTALTDAYATIKVLANTQGRRVLQLVVNQVLKPGEGRTVRGQLQQVIDRYVSPGLEAPVRLDYLGEVPVDPAVREAVQKRQLLLELYPGSPAAQAVLVVAARVVP